MLISVQKKFNNCLCSATVFAIAMFFGVVIGVVSPLMYQTSSLILILLVLNLMSFLGFNYINATDLAAAVQ